MTKLFGFPVVYVDGHHSCGYQDNTPDMVTKQHKVTRGRGISQCEIKKLLQGTSCKIQDKSAKIKHDDYFDLNKLAWTRTSQIKKIKPTKVKPYKLAGKIPDKTAGMTADKMAFFDTNACAVCLSTYREILSNDLHIVVNDCGHPYCCDCADKLIVKRISCPRCKKDVHTNSFRLMVFGLDYTMDDRNRKVYL